MVYRLIKYFCLPTVLVGYTGWVVSVGLPATGILTPLLGWILTGSGVVAFIAFLFLLPRSISRYKDENDEIKLRQKPINLLRKVLDNLEQQIDTMRISIEDTPLSYYEEKYLTKFDDYENFKKKYSSDNNARYVALGIHYGLDENPLFNDSLKDNTSIQSLSTEIDDLKYKLPDTLLHSLIEWLINTKKLQSVSIISHKLNPARWDAYVSEIKQREEVESKLDETLRRVKREINRRLIKLSNGAKYE